MASGSDNFNSALFMEEIQKYECLYNKLCKDYKNKFIRLNCWKKSGKSFRLLQTKRKISTAISAIHSLPSFIPSGGKILNLDPGLAQYTRPHRRSGQSNGNSESLRSPAHYFERSLQLRHRGDYMETRL